MKQRLAWLAKLYTLYILLFVLQKLAFMLVCTPSGAHYGPAQWLDVVTHGLLLDVPVAGYLIALPLLVAIATAWVPRPLRLRRWMAAYHIIVALAVMLMIVADMAIYPFWQFKLDATIFFYTDSPRQALASVSGWFVAVCVACIVLFAALVAWALCALTPSRLRPIAAPRRRLALTALLVVATGPLVISIRGGLGESTANIGRVYYSTDQYLNHAAINPCFSLLASLGKADDYASEFNYYDEATRQQLFRGLYRPTPHLADTLLRYRRPNVLVIILEGFGGQFVDGVGTRPDVAPNYNRLSHEGVLFTNCFSNSFRTDRGTVSTLSGYPSFPTQSVMKLPMKSRTLPCLAASLATEGYASSFIYGGDINFTNMQSYLRTGGYAHIVSDVDFPASALRDNPWGAADNVTFARLGQLMAEQRLEPWHICYLTLSSHEPWKVPYSRYDDPIANAFAFTDHCLGQFVDSLRSTPTWENTLLVVLPDHGFAYPMGITHHQHHHNTMLWLGGALARPRVIDTYMNQSDMAATLLAQLDIDHSSYTFSRNVLSPEYTYPFAFYTFKEGIGFVDHTGHTVYDIIGNRVSENHDNSPAHPATEQRVSRAKAILQSIYDDLGAR